jgi:broad-specificity NMP kinase
MKEKVWVPMSGSLYSQSKQDDYPSTLEVGVYELGYVDRVGFNLTPISKDFDFPYKIYGLETDIIRRALKYYRNTNTGNLGILLNGIKGTGKTVTAKQICNQLNLPVILVSNHLGGSEDFINSIQQDVVVFIDEYEKIYEDSHDFLTIMDGALNSAFRRTFILTTNSLHIDANLIDRPSRIRYLKTFSNLSVEIVSEIVDDILKLTEFRQDCINYISTLEIITVDIVKAIVNETNIQEESPLAFKSIFNARVKTGKYKVFTEVNGEVLPFMRNVKVSHRPEYGDEHIGRNFYIDDVYIGRIKEVIDLSTLKVLIEESVDEDWDDEDEDDNTKTKKEVVKTTPLNLPAGYINFVIKDDFVYNDVYKYGERDFSGVSEGAFNF